MTDYKRLGAKARSSGASRESCRFKAQNIRDAWLAGWDERDRSLTEARRRHDEAAAVLRWHDTTSYSQGERGRVPPRCWELRSSRLHGWSMTIVIAGATTCLEIKQHGQPGHYREFVGMDLDRVREMAIDELRTQIRDSIERSKAVLVVLDEEPRS